jgi:hypothetical protein
MNVEPLPVDDALAFYDNALYGIYNNMVHELFPDSLDMDAESWDALVPCGEAINPKRET